MPTMLDNHLEIALLTTREIYNQARKHFFTLAETVNAVSVDPIAPEQHRINIEKALDDAERACIEAMHTYIAAAQAYYSQNAPHKP